MQEVLCFRGDPPTPASSCTREPDQAAIVLSSSPWRLEDQEKRCGTSCGKVLVVGNSPTGAVELYTPTCPALVGKNLKNLACVS